MDAPAPNAAPSPYLSGHLLARFLLARRVADAAASERRPAEVAPLPYWQGFTLDDNLRAASRPTVAS